MDESERRRERLKAMRNEAALGEASSASQVLVSGYHGGLANPLTDASPSQEVSRSTPRFDYYTDPMASFSANRRGNVGSHGPRGFVPIPSHGRVPPIAQTSAHPESWNARMVLHPFPGPTAYQAHCSFDGSFPCGTPVGFESSFLPHHEMPPGVINPPGCAVSFHPKSNLPRGANFPDSAGLSGRHDFGFGQGRGRSFKGSYSGRGRGNWSCNKGRMGSEHSSIRDQGLTHKMPQSLYEKFMVEDPWKSLTPSLWVEKTRETFLPASKTVGTKRPLEISRPCISNSQSLAEYLADSFNEAVNGDQDA